MKVVDASDRELVRENKNLRERETDRVKKEKYKKEREREREREREVYRKRLSRWRDRIIKAWKVFQ